ncbi:MAG: hypothetical protein FWD65_04380 [Coriobacteriia bacterium]|nr:hypothetical protein [Coriobacteriia bacterium]
MSNALEEQQQPKKAEADFLRSLHSDQASRLQLFKALSYIAAGCVQIIEASPSLIVLSVQGSGSVPYLVRYGTEGDRLITECSCTHGLLYGDGAHCCHLLIARMLASKQQQ